MENFDPRVHRFNYRATFPINVEPMYLFNPQGRTLQIWNKLFVISCILAVCVDPLFFCLPLFNSESSSLDIDTGLAYTTTYLRTTTTLRTLLDLFYLIRIYLQFHTAYVIPSSRVNGRSELVVDPEQIAARYLKRYFIVDLLALVPAPQAVVLKFLRNLESSEVLATKQKLFLIVNLQYIPRFARFIPLTSEVKKSANVFDVFAGSAWAGAASFWLWYMIFSHYNHQGHLTSTYSGEVLFSIALAISGLVVFALLIGNMQSRRI